MTQRQRSNRYFKMKKALRLTTSSSGRATLADLGLHGIPALVNGEPWSCYFIDNDGKIMGIAPGSGRIYPKTPPKSSEPSTAIERLGMFDWKIRFAFTPFAEMTITPVPPDSQ